ncbi:MAG: DUF4038 domain-containing protein [Melioribacteraceae bacterium]|nr:DUF4038 domain-containing protein [Melioribacteraceae bacterium]
MKEIKLIAQKNYNNFYMDVTCWIELTGPGFSKRVYGFWNGGNEYIIRVVATAPGRWQWKSFSSQSDDKGLNNHTGSFNAIEWTDDEKKENPNRHGFLRPTSNGHALQYADGTPYFMIGDTWLAGSTWRLPFRNAAASYDYVPGPGMGFEDAVMYRKRQGFNSISMISCFPNWESDINPSTYADSNNIFIRNAWEKFGYDVRDLMGADTSGYWGTLTAKNMRDEYGNLPFEMSKVHKGVSDFTRINPEYFKSLDKKMEFLSEQGFAALLETVRRDAGPSWKAYYNFSETFSRFVQYLISRYGAYNIIFSGIHLDWIPKEFSLTAEEFNDALTYHLHKYGPMPFGQPVTTLISSSTYSVFGHDKDCPWLTMHSVGNKPRDHRVADSLEIIFRLEPPYPAINFEPYYTGWNHEINKPAGERPPADSDRDNYFARAQMYGSVLSGGLSGHVHGTAAYDITTTGEPEGARPHIWEAIKYNSADYMKHLNTFVQSEGPEFQNLLPARYDIIPDKAPGSPPDGLDGWAYMMRNSEKDFALLYFENESVVPVLNNFIPEKKYSFTWFDTITGEWSKQEILKSDFEGRIKIPHFPGGEKNSSKDWAAKILLAD